MNGRQRAPRGAASDPGRSGLAWEGTDAREETQVQEALNRIVLDALSPVAGGLAVLYAIFAVSHRIVLPPDAATPMMIVAALSSVAFFGLRSFIRRLRPAPSRAHPLGAVVAGIVLANSLLHLYLTAEPRQTTNLLLLILGVGILFLDAGWFAVVVTATFVGWIAVLSSVTPEAEWIHFGFALAGAAVLAGVVLLIRIRTFRRIEELHFQDRMKQLELKSALARTEAARKGERDAREALEAAVQELREREEHFRRLADASFEGVVVQQEGRIVDANSRAVRLFGLRPGALVGADLGRLLAEEDRPRVLGFLRGVVEPDRESIRARGIREDGEPFPLEVRRASTTHRGEPASVGIFRDVTEQKEVEEMLRRAAAEAEASSRAKSAFLANMSHELRTPLNSVIGFANILQKNQSGNLNEKEMGYLERIVSNGKHLLELIGDVLDLSKVEAGKMESTLEPVDLRELAREALRTVEVQADRKGVELVSELPDALEPLETDPHRLRQVILNLLGNAVKFTDEGRVVLRVRTDESGEPEVIEVEDTGIGIAEDRLDRIFEAFQQADGSTARRYGGTGLGLTISRSLCELLGYAMEVESREGEGTRFSIVLNPRGADAGTLRRGQGPPPGAAPRSSASEQPSGTLDS